MNPSTSTWNAILQQRCPRCRAGKIFGSLFVMQPACPHCGLIFEREPGYFLGAMYFSYAMSAAVLGIGYFVALLLLPEWDGVLLATVVMVAYLPLVPAIFRYSRTLWIYFDRHFWPTDTTR